jgi:carbamoyltransferase
MNDTSIYILGISAFYHDSAACLLKDGKVIAAASEERFTRKKHDASFPVNAIAFCLKFEGISSKEISYVAYYEKPVLKFDRILSTFINAAPKGFIPFRMAIKSWLKEKLWISSVIKKEIGYAGEIRYCKHHESHAASAFFTSSYDKAAFITIDGVGETATTTYGIAADNKITTLQEIYFPHSLGLLYSAFTYYCGFKVNSGEYKLMGLAPFGKPVYVDLIKQNLITINPDGSFYLNMKYFPYEYSLKMINKKFCKLFGHPERDSESTITQFYKDVASSIQKVTEEIVMLMAKHVKQVTQMENLCLAGGVALNCVANGLLQRSGIYKDIWIQPAAGDSGTAIGAALLVWHQCLDHSKAAQADDLHLHSFLGPAGTNDEVLKLLHQYNIKVEQPDFDALTESVADMLNNKSVVGWFSGRMEFGPRALGNRTILASPVFKDMQKHLNLKIKKREGFRPFAPIVLAEHASEWFDMPPKSKAMLFTYACKKPDQIPACVHVDHSSRVQTVHEPDNPKIHRLLRAFQNISGCPVLINTSLNVRGEPIVCTAEDALKCFFNTDMDAIVIEDFLIIKESQSGSTLSKIIIDYEPD